MFDILSLIPGKKKKTHNGWYSFNAICCTHNGGHRTDTRNRGGLRIDGNNWVMHCFNCNYSCSFTLGKQLTGKTKQLLSWCGYDYQQIQKWNLESLKHKDILDLANDNQVIQKIEFVKKRLPVAEELDIENPAHKFYVDYLNRRMIDINNYEFYVTPTEKGRNKDRVIIPYTYKGKIVGHTNRYLDNKVPKYINIDQQSGYVFNIDKQKHDWQVCIVTEGIFDALCIDGVALMHNDISELQARSLATLNRRIIVVPDRDEPGLKLIDKALEFGYSISLPNWEQNVKDVNDAVMKYGRLPTLLSILQNATTSKIKVEMQRRKIAKGI